MSKSISNNLKSSDKIERFEVKHFKLLSLFSCNPQKCGNPNHYHDYMMFNALPDAKSGMGQTYVLCRYVGNEPSRIIGFFTLKATSLVSSGGGTNIEGKPAIEISEFAVDQQFEGHGIGSNLLQIAVGICNIVRKTQIGVRYVVVCAQHKAEGFYHHVMDFERVGNFYTIPRQLWNDDCIPMVMELPELR